VRPILPLAALLLLVACDVDNNPESDQVTVTYDRERIKQAGEDAKDVARGVGNVAESTGRAIKDEVGDVDVDVDVRRSRDGDASAAPPAAER
jgi:multidrug efflux pump subunit AcrB